MPPDAGPDRAVDDAWAAYDAHRFDLAESLAHDAAEAAADAGSRARCLLVVARVRHARGDLAGAEGVLADAVLAETVGAASVRAAADALLGAVRLHQGRPVEALGLLAPAIDAALPRQRLDALIFTGHALALTGRLGEALEVLDRAADDATRDGLPVVASRATNTGGWVLRCLGEPDEAVDRHHRALEQAGHGGADEVAIAALEDIAEDALDRGNVAMAWRRLEEAESSLMGDLEFGWRLGMRLRLLQGRVALARGDAESARTYARILAGRAAAAGIPRYAAMARLLGHQATVGLGETVDPAQAEPDLTDAQTFAAPESWWWTGVLGAETHRPEWVLRAAEQVSALADAAGPRGGALRASAAPRLDAWRAASG